MQSVCFSECECDFCFSWRVLALETSDLRTEKLYSLALSLWVFRLRVRGDTNTHTHTHGLERTHLLHSMYFIDSPHYGPNRSKIQQSFSIYFIKAENAIGSLGWLCLVTPREAEAHCALETFTYNNNNDSCNVFEHGFYAIQYIISRWQPNDRANSISAHTATPHTIPTYRY